MPDYDCFPIWILDENSLDNIDPNDLKISSKLKKALLAWSDSYDKTLNREDPILSGVSSKKAELNFELEGKRLYLELKKHLRHDYKDYKFGYFSVKDYLLHFNT